MFLFIKINTKIIISIIRDDNEHKSTNKKSILISRNVLLTNLKIIGKETISIEIEIKILKIKNRNVFINNLGYIIKESFFNVYINNKYKITKANKELKGD